jgi:hypothetical protein
MKINELKTENAKNARGTAKSRFNAKMIVHLRWLLRVGLYTKCTYQMMPDKSTRSKS